MKENTLTPILLLSSVARRGIYGALSRTGKSVLDDTVDPRLLQIARSYFLTERNEEKDGELVHALSQVVNEIWAALLEASFFAGMCIMAFAFFAWHASLRELLITTTIIQLVTLLLMSLNSLVLRRRVVAAESQLSFRSLYLSKLEGELVERTERRATINRTQQPTTGEPLPAPPGITEIALENDSDGVFAEMRKHLTSVRRYHRIVLWTLIVTFLAFLSAGLWKMITGLETTSDYIQAFGSAGVGGMLLWFGQKTLWAHRVSQVSLALFESYVAEVRASLAEIPLSVPVEERRRMRAEIWTTFRNGLNQLWLSEREAVKAGSQD